MNQFWEALRLHIFAPFILISWTWQLASHLQKIWLKVGQPFVEILVCMVTFVEVDENGEEHALHSGDVRPLHQVTEDTEPGDGYLCPSCPFPWFALHYPSRRVFHRKGRTLFDPPHGQPRFNDKSLKGFMDIILYRGHKPLRTGFFYNEESGAVFGEESAMEHLAQQLYLFDEGQERHATCTRKIFESTY